MGVILIRPKLKKEHSDWLSPPLGLLYLGAVLEENKIPVTILDLALEDISYEDLKKKIDSLKPELIGIGSIVTPIYENAAALVETIKSFYGGLVAMGGPHPTALPIDVLNESRLDIVVQGEGEKTIVDLYNAIKDGKDLSSVRGITFKKAGKIISTGPGDIILDLDKIPFPARHLVPMQKYFDLRGSREMFTRRYPATSIITSRGCPYNCVFCSRYFGKKWRARSPKNVVDEIEELVTKYGVKEINFEDENFSLKKDRAVQICDEIIKRKLNITFKFTNGLKPETLDIELFRKMKKAGCFYVAFGIETGSPKVLKRIKKGVDHAKILNAINLAHKAGMIVHGFFMIGHPDETEDEFNQTIEFAKKAGLDIVGLSVLTPFPGTEIYDSLKEKGLLKDVKWSSFFLHDKPVFNGSNMSSEDILRLKKKFYPSVYLRPKYLFLVAPRLLWKTGFKPRDIIYYIRRFSKLTLRGKLT